MSISIKIIMGVWFAWGPAMTILVLAFYRGWSHRAKNYASILSIAITLGGAVAGVIVL